MSDGQFASSETVSASVRAASHTVLVAEDEQDMLELISRRIERLGHRVLRAHNGKEALNILLRHQVDLVVTDINMPGYSGMEVLSEAKARDPYTQVIIVTANATLDNAIEALNRGAFSYLTKPFDHISVISSAVERALEFRRLTIDNLRMAEAQRRRGDMLEDEVTDRLRQLNRQEHAYRDLLARLPVGIIVASSNGIYQAKNPTAERWLSRDENSRERHLRRFMNELKGEKRREIVRIREISGRELRFRATVLNRYGENVEWLVLVEDLTDAAQSVARSIAPLVADLARRLSPGIFTDRSLFLAMAQRIGAIERICLDLGVNPHEATPTGAPHRHSERSDSGA